MTIRNTWRGCVLPEVDEVCPQAVTTKATAAMATQRFIYSEFTEYGSQEALRQTTGMFLRSCQLRPGLFAAAVTTVPFSGCDVRLSTHETDVVPLYPTSGATVAWHDPRALPETAAVAVNVTVEGPDAPICPPRFFSCADTEHGEPQRDVSTETTE